MGDFSLSESRYKESQVNDKKYTGTETFGFPVYPDALDTPEAVGAVFGFESKMCEDFGESSDSQTGFTEFTELNESSGRLEVSPSSRSTAMSTMSTCFSASPAGLVGGLAVNSLKAEDEFTGAFLHLDKWKSSYQRNYRKCGGKNLRCFPYCKPVHLSTTFCGDSVKVQLKMSPFRTETMGNKTFCAFAEFVPLMPSLLAMRSMPTMTSPSQLARTKSLGQMGHFGRQTALVVGQAIPKDVVHQRVTAVKEQVTWWPGVEATSSDSQSPRSRSSQASLFTEFTIDQLREGSVVEFNREQRAWHYGYISGKTSKNVKHVLKVYVLAAEEQEDMYKCVAVFNSPEFQLYGRKSKSSKKEIERRDSAQASVTLDTSFELSGSLNPADPRDDTQVSLDSFSESFDSESFDFDFDGTEVVNSMNDLDQHLEELAIPPIGGGLSRKRSFLDYGRESVDAVDDASVSAQSMPGGLKKQRSMRTMRKVSALDNFLDEFDSPLGDNLVDVEVESNATNESSSPLSRTSSNLQPVRFSKLSICENPRENQLRAQAQFGSSGLSRCASAPQMRPKKKLSNNLNIFQLNDPRKQAEAPSQKKLEEENVQLVLLLFKEITQNKTNDKFINIITKFLLSENETLTEVIHSSIKETLANRAADSTNWRAASLCVLKSCYRFLETNFPPFRTFCSKNRNSSLASQLSKQEVEQIMNTLVKYQYGYVPRELLPVACEKDTSFDFMNFMGCFRGRWVQEEGSKANLTEFYKKAGIPAALADAVAGMEWSMTAEFESDISTLVVKRKDKLFCSGMARYIYDGQVRPWTLSNPFLSEKYNVKQYDACLDIPHGEIIINYYLQKSAKITKVMRVVGGVLEINFIFCQKRTNGTWVECCSTKAFAKRSN